jgi:DNA modification methylase
VSYTIHTGACLDVLKTLDDHSVQCVVTSPPYWQLRDYGVDGQLGQERTWKLYVEALVDVFREVRRVLRTDGTVWLNLGDTYVAKNLQGIPWRVAFALQDSGWIIRNDNIWNKPNPMMESSKDRCTRSHEYVFLLAQSPRYYFNADAIAEPMAEQNIARYRRAVETHEVFDPMRHKHTKGVQSPMDVLTRAAAGVLARGTRNKRTVWTIPTGSFDGAHFATFPTELPELCILAGSRPGDTVLDIFNGAGTTGLVALHHHRHYIGIELNPDNVRMTHERLQGVAAKKEAKKLRDNSASLPL